MCPAPDPPRWNRSPNRHYRGEPYNNYWGCGNSYWTEVSIRYPADTFMLSEDADSRTGGWNVGTWCITWNLHTPSANNAHAQSFTWLDPVPMYHGNVSTFGFADGHAYFHRWTDGNRTAAGLMAAMGKSAAASSIPNSGWD